MRDFSLLSALPLQAASRRLVRDVLPISLCCVAGEKNGVSHMLVSIYYGTTIAFRVVCFITWQSSRDSKLFLILLYLVAESQMPESCIMCIHISSWVSVGGQRSSCVMFVLFKAGSVVTKDQDWQLVRLVYTWSRLKLSCKCNFIYTLGKLEMASMCCDRRPNK